MEHEDSREFCYQIDVDYLITFVNEDWLSFAHENGVSYSTFDHVQLV